MENDFPEKSFPPQPNTTIVNLGRDIPSTIGINGKGSIS